MRHFAFLALFTASLLAQAPDPFLAWLDRIAQAQLDARAQRIAAIRTKAEAERRQAEVRAKMMELLGGLPSYNGPLRARVTGTLDGGTHVIEKVIFESLPGIYITGNLYRPKQPGRYPGVLVPSGHTQEGKPETQQLAANLAAKGFVALSYDPIGQGEREQTYLPELGRSLSGGGGNEHLELGARSILIGQSVARYFIHDAKRGVDYLISRPDVDANRIGVTGCSGGGATTTYAGAFDPRVKAAAPGCFINSFRTLFTGPTADSEMSFPRFLAGGLDMADFFEMAAPLPWLMMATTEDYFAPAGARTVYDEARRFYETMGAADRIEFFVGTGPHGTPTDSREAIYRFLTRWLKNGQGETRDQPVKLFTNLELMVTKGANVAFEPGARKFWQVIADEARLRRPKRPALPKLDVPPAPAVAPSVSIVATGSGKGYRIEELRFESEPGIPVSGRLYVPDGAGRRPAVVMFEEKRLRQPLFVQLSQSTAALAEAMAQRGHVVLEFYPRDSPDAYEGRPFLGNWTTNERADLVGRPLALMRAYDLRVAMSVLAARPEVDASSIRGYARGVKGIWLLLAAMGEPRLGKLWLDRMPTSFAAGLESPIMSHLFDVLIPGFAQQGDIADLINAVGEKRVFRTDPANWMNRVITVSGPGYRYRTVAEGDGPSLDAFLAEPDGPRGARARVEGSTYARESGPRRKSSFASQASATR